jgi:outer membrane murein-binding lipoprotein Lpp
MVIVGALSFAGTYISNHKSNAIWQYRVQQLEEKQDKHNNIIERTYKLERDMDANNNNIKNAFNQIHDIKSSVDKLDNNFARISDDIQHIKETEVRLKTQMENYHGN